MERPTWRNFVATAPEGYWRFPSVDTAPAPDTEALLEGYEAIAEFLGVDAGLIEREAQRLRLPFLIRTVNEKVTGRRGIRDEWVDAQYARARRAAPISTAHALMMWEALNDFYASHRIASHIPGSRR